MSYRAALFRKGRPSLLYMTCLFYIYIYAPGCFRSFAGVKKKFIPFGCAFLLYMGTGTFSACKKQTDPGHNPEVYRQQMDVAYGNHPRQKADIYLPAGRDAQTPTLVLIHGGGWTTGDKTEMLPFVDTALMRQNRLAVVNMNYRLATADAYKHPSQVEDIGRLLDFLQVLAAEYHINPDRFALAGASAGGHLGMLYDDAFDTGDRVKAVVACVAPTDFLVPEILNDTAQYLAVYGLLGKTHWEDMGLWYAAGPYRVCGTHTSPTALFMGGADPIVPVSQGEKLKARLDSLGVPATLTVYEGAGHGWWPGGPVFADTRQKIMAWLNAHL